MRVLLHDPTGSLQPHRAEELVGALAEASGLPIGIYVQGAGGSALAATLAAARAGAQLIACAIYPLALIAPPRLRARRWPRRSPGSGSIPASTSPRSGEACRPRRRAHRRRAGGAALAARSPSARRSTTSRRASSPASTRRCAPRTRATGSRRCSRSSTRSAPRPAGRRSRRRSARCSRRRRSSTSSPRAAT